MPCWDFSLPIVFSIFQDVKKRREEVTKKHQYEIRVMQNWTGWVWGENGG